MVDGSKYHSVYMRSPKLFNWTKTNGGPHYMDVGKNIEVEYETKENVTISTIDPKTNKTFVSFKEETLVKTWIYYDYSPANVEFYYYKDAIVKHMKPHSGILSGGTVIEVMGAWFKYMPEYGVVPHCRFGDKIVRAVFESTVRIICTAPPGTELGVALPFEVSMNGVDFVNSGFTFTYYEQPLINDVTPDSGPAAGGTPIYFVG